MDICREVDPPEAIVGAGTSVFCHLHTSAPGVPVHVKDAAPARDDEPPGQLVDIPRRRKEM
jgi:hypothetical protein